MKKPRSLYLACGFIAGVAYITACGSTSTSLAEALGNAIDVLFDNTTSELSATTVQDAIDEIDATVDLLSGKGLSTSLVGTWTGTAYDDENDFEDIVLTLAGDGTYECSGSVTASGSTFTNPTVLHDSHTICDGETAWEIVGHSLRLTATGSITTSSGSESSGESGGTSASSATKSTTTATRAILPIQRYDGTTLTLLAFYSDASFVVVDLVRQSP